ncbi:hypothetical protein BHE74_00021785 [Ensete ventricosum]|nr:hypothetical protein GW17_00007742 [Ensete ventricosum]RWW70522.1 hypothetical protein BHE74_00021785 [Ensete ventricosum]RZR77057.1 hypothetical protein BHM03_00002033 [Ensete ventricosum]
MPPCIPCNQSIPSPAFALSFSWCTVSNAINASSSPSILLPSPPISSPLQPFSASPLPWEPDCPPPVTWSANDCTLASPLQRRRMRELCKKSRSLKRLLSVTVGRRRSRDEEHAQENASPVRESRQVELMLDVSSPPLKPTWRCFSYNEIHKATNGFHQGLSFLGFMRCRNENCMSKSDLVLAVAIFLDLGR